MKINMVILIITTVFTGLMAGLFYAWSISVTPGLAQVSDENYLRAFQSMNRAILNPAFFIVFMGLIFLLPLLLYLYSKSPVTNQFWYILFAAGFYLGGCILITFFGNVPMNNTLEVLQIESMTPEQMTSFRLGFENKWNQLNMIRTISCLVSSLLLVMACIQNSTS